MVARTDAQPQSTTTAGTEQPPPSATPAPTVHAGRIATKRRDVAATLRRIHNI